MLVFHGKELLVNYENYVEFCKTDWQKQVLEAIRDSGGNITKAAKRLDKGRSTVSEIYGKIIRNAARQGYSPDHGMTHAVPDGYHVKGTSTLYDLDGNPKMQWVKSSLDHERQKQLIEEFTESFIKEVPPLESIPEPKKIKFDKDIIPWFQIGDAHIGMLSHEAEVGHNFDLKIAERELIKAMTLLIERSPVCERCVIQDLGDGTHYENMTATTEASGHALDADGRHPKMIRVYAKVMRAIIEKALTRFKYVDVIVNQGNHSRTNDFWMAILLEHLYKKCKRLTVLDNSSVFIPYRMGNVFVLCHHTDKCKPVQLAGVMANDFAQDWGETKYHYIDGGHVHHSQSKKELNGAIYESWNQLAPIDKYAHDKGYRSRSCLTMVERSKTYGEVGRKTVTIEEIKDILESLPAGTTANKRRDVYSV